ncbi:hypothetical protein G6F62_008360 [Rhizopus arrhizus]|nr:hypothetical protein G6F21_011440 [Rhizopus arrhizus]KAG0786095.1 hypothetical protein G6F22_007732 [Rhizopus arrhizus]KAG0805708.1 hypothetical protein G6F20_011689 [Rhizopus arrhizus]KAG0821710.1 hypothetical protein G6F19_011782 [Rhizopus arrhizus]KAG0839061.1 hypothetical protein G6F18_004264 [Rhizopus arrhizus]
MNTKLSPSADGGLANTNLESSTRLGTVQRFLKRYIRMNKLVGNINDKYAVVLLKEKAEWWKPFTSDEQTACSYLDELREEVKNKEYERLDLGSLMKVIETEADLKNRMDFTQAIVVYSRTNIIPDLETSHAECFEIRNLPNVTLDVLFLHNVDDRAQPVFDVWTSLDSERVPGWYYEIANVLGQDKISKALCQLLAHPLQRGDQERITNLL